MKKHWKKEEIDYLHSNLNKKTVSDIAIDLGRSEMSVNLFMYRHKIAKKTQIQKNIMRDLVKIKFVDANYFTPNRSFFQAVNISQKRWGQLMLGYAQATQKEMMSVASHLQLSSEEAIKLIGNCQLDLFE